jgi:hypothetical protein
VFPDKYSKNKYYLYIALSSYNYPSGVKQVKRDIEDELEET